MSDKLNIEVDKTSLVNFLNVLCDAMLEDECGLTRLVAKDKLSVNDRLLTTNRFAGPADVGFVVDMLPALEQAYPGIFDHHSPILRFIEHQTARHAEATEPVASESSDPPQ